MNFYYIKSGNLPRIISRFLDYVILLFFSILLFMICNISKDAMIFHAYKNNSITPIYIGPYSFNIYCLLIMCMIFLYFIIFPYFFKGKTIAKIIFKTQIISACKVNNLSIRQLIYRELLISLLPILSIFIIFLFTNIKHNYYLSSFEYNNKSQGAYFFVNWLYYLNSLVLLFFSLCLLLSKSNIGIHDRMANTIVVKVSEKSNAVNSFKSINQDKKINNSLILDLEKIDNE